MSYGLCNNVLRLVQQCLTACATMSYGLCNNVLRFMEMAGKQFSHLWNCLCNCVLRLVQLCLTFVSLVLPTVLHCALHSSIWLHNFDSLSCLVRITVVFPFIEMVCPALKIHLWKRLYRDILHLWKRQRVTKL